MPKDGDKITGTSDNASQSDIDNALRVILPVAIPRIQNMLSANPSPAQTVFLQSILDQAFVYYKRIFGYDYGSPPPPDVSPITPPTLTKPASKP